MLGVVAGRFEDGWIGLLGVAGLGWARGTYVVATLTDSGKWGKWGGGKNDSRFLKRAIANSPNYWFGSCRSPRGCFFRGLWVGRLEDGSIVLLGVAGLGWACGKYVVATPIGSRRWAN